MHLRQPAFTDGACAPFNLKHIYKDELDKACFAPDAGYSDSKGLVKRTISDKILKNRSYEIAKNPKCIEYQRVLASMVY